MSACRLTRHWRFSGEKQGRDSSFMKLIVKLDYVDYMECREMSNFKDMVEGLIENRD